MNDTIQRYRAFLDSGKTERECVKEIIRLAEGKGYRNIEETGQLQPGDKVYYTQYGKSIALFHIGTDEAEKGMNILGAHIDSPRLDVKMNPLYESDGIVYLDTHYYGGIKKYQWVTIPLAIHGIVALRDGSTREVIIGEDDDMSFCISDILPHMAQEQMKKTASEFIPGEDLDLIIGLDTENDENAKDAGRKRILAALSDRIGMDEKDFQSAELEIVPAGKAKLMGLDGSMILAYGQDDRVCAFTSLDALLEADTVRRTCCCLLVDKEEIGSVGATGMDSVLFENAAAEVLQRTDGYDGLKLRRMMRSSCMLSSDVNAAYDPLNASLYDRKNSSILGKGVVFNKYTGARGKSGASDANAEFIAKLRNTMDSASVEYQITEMGKVDTGGGGTIARYAAYYGMQVIDCGVAVLSMHSPWEITAVRDVLSAKDCYKAFLQMV